MDSARKEPVVSAETVQDFTKDAKIYVTEVEEAQILSRKSKYLSSLPWANVVEILVVLITITGAAILVGLLNGREQWPATVSLGVIAGKEREMPLISPQVILSLVHSVIAFLIGLAVKDAITIAWWRKTMKGGTVRDLERDYRFGTSLSSAFLAGKSFNLIALATLGAAIAALAQGPLMQRALNVYLSTKSSQVTLHSKLADTLPLEYSGISYGNDGNLAVTTTFSKKFSSIVKQYQNNAPLSPWIEGCDGNCKGEIPAFGFAPDCHTVTKPLDLVWSQKKTGKHETSDLTDVYTKPETLFSTAFEQESYTPNIKFTLVLTNLDKPEKEVNPHNTSIICPGHQTTQICTLRPAIIKYPVHAVKESAQAGSSTDSIVTLSREISPLNYGVDSLVKLHVTNTPVGGWDFNRVGGIVLALNYLLKTSFKMSGVNTRESTATLRYNGLTALNYVQLAHGKYGQGTTCQMQTTDPTEDIIGAINEIMFRVAIQLSDEKQSVKFSQADQITPVNRYLAYWAYLAASVAVTVLGVALIIPAFWGWWEVYWKASLNPIEIAEAFNAPALQTETPHKNTDHLIEVIGGREVKYAPVTRAEAAEREGGDQATLTKMAIVNMSPDHN